MPNAKEPLVVPVHLDALCVGEGDTGKSFASATAQFDRLPYHGKY